VLAVVIAGMALALAVAKPWAADGGAAASSLGPGASSGADSSDAPATAATGASGDTPMSSGDAPVGPPGLLLVGAGRGVIPLPGGGTLDCADPQGWRLYPGRGPGRSTPPCRLRGSPAARWRVLASARPSQPSECGGWTVARPVRHERHAWRGSVPATGGPGGLARAGGLPGAPAVWAPGRYALQLLARGADPEDAWLVVEIVPAA